MTTMNIHLVICNKEILVSHTDDMSCDKTSFRHLLVVNLPTQPTENWQNICQLN